MYSDAAYVDVAKSWADVIVKDHYRGPGDLDNALRAASREANVPHGFLWNLRYRRSSIKLPPFGYLLNLAVAYGKKRRAGANTRDPMADAVASEFLKLAEAFREMDTDICRAEADALLDTAQSLCPRPSSSRRSGSPMAQERGEA